MHAVLVQLCACQMPSDKTIHCKSQNKRTKAKGVGRRDEVWGIWGGQRRTRGSEEEKGGFRGPEEEKGGLGLSYPTLLPFTQITHSACPESRGSFSSPSPVIWYVTWLGERGIKAVSSHCSVVPCWHWGEFSVSWLALYCPACRLVGGKNRIIYLAAAGSSSLWQEWHCNNSCQWGMAPAATSPGPPLNMVPGACAHSPPPQPCTYLK